MVKMRFLAAAVVATTVGSAGCLWDLTDDGNVGIDDLLELFSVWGPCPDPCPPFCRADFNADCSVGVGDLLDMFAHWGPCP